MFDIDKWQEIFHSLSKNPFRTALTAFGVFWGIFMLVVIMGAGNGLEKGAQSGFEGTATNSLYLWAQRTSIAYKGLPPSRFIQMNTQAWEALQRGIPEADIIAPRNQLGGWQGGNNVTRGVKSGGFEVSGDMPDIIHVEGPMITEGRFLNPFDIENSRKVAVIGPRVKEILFEPEENPIGEYIHINGVYFQVVGVFDVREAGGRGERLAQKIYTPFTTFQRAFNYGNRVSWFAITSQDNIPVSEVEEKVISLLQTRHKIAPEDRRAFGHFNLEERFMQFVNLMKGIKLISWFVGILTLVAGVIGVSNIMLIIVKERTKEIGVRRAVGAKPLSIVGLIVWEAVILTSLAGYLGMVCGVGVLELVNYFMEASEIETGFFQSPSVDVQLIINALIILVIGGVFAGLIPARRALSISPVDALRAE
ncbi:MAG: ABC transporter permease [Bacteroidia bacterium]